MEELFRTLPALLKEFEGSDDVRDAVLAAAWKKVAGNSLARHTVAVGSREKTLEVAVSDSIWKRHLESLSGQMIFKLNSVLGRAAVTYIEFRVDEEAVRRAGNDAGATGSVLDGFEKTAAEQRSPALMEAAKEIADPALRELFLDAAANCLARRKIRSAG